MPGNDLTLIRLLAYMSVRHRAHAKAQALYEALLALDEDDRDAAKGLAWAHLEGGNPREALKVLDAIAGEPGSVVQLLRARALARLGQPEDAGAAMRAFLASRPRPGPGRQETLR